MGYPSIVFFIPKPRRFDPGTRWRRNTTIYFIADFFRRRIQELKPDLVHFYHLQRLSASAIDVCREMGIPSLFTATDFWLVCPTNQLLLPDRSLCLGPDKGMVNCVRHLAAISQGKRIQSILDRLPDWLMAVLIRWIRCTAFPA